MTNRSLSQRLKKANILLIAAVVLLGATAITSLVALRINTGKAIEEYREMMILKHIEEGLQRAELLLHQEAIEPDTLTTELGNIKEQIFLFLQAHGEEEGETGVEAERERSEVHAAEITFDEISIILEHIDEDHNAAQLPQTIYVSLDTELDRIRKLAADPDVNRVQRQASKEAWIGVTVVGMLSIFLIIMTILISRALHSRIVGSIHQLQAGARQIALGHFSRRVKEQGDEEIVALARDFNNMGTQLEMLYRDMERRIDLKSRELVRSERLASVGFLAAGVAHEINNPLGIINGYATMARNWLSGTPDNEQIVESADAFKIIGEEAFRCKKIVEQLVTLSMIGDGTRKPISLQQIVEELITLVHGLERSKSRSIVYDNPTGSPPDDQFIVIANTVELKQVVLNLIVNAIDATDEHNGLITVTLHRTNGRILLAVNDNGCGIDAEKIEYVYEPFFSSHSNGENHRLGLGLTISHAIVEAHHGHLRVESQGNGKGTRFIVDLPDEHSA